MRNLIRVTCLLLVLAGGSVWLMSGSRSPVGSAAQDETKRPTKTFMRQKLKDAQEVLEGLALEDFELIKKGADRMRHMSKATEWHVIAGPEYVQHSAEFRRCCEELFRQADKKNIDAAAMSYLHLTTTCIDCHKFVRSTRIARNLRPALLGDDTLLAGFQFPARPRP